MPYTEIDIDDYQAQFVDNGTDFVLIDVRESDEYEDGHIPNAISVPLSELQSRYDEVTQDKPVVLVCARGGRSVMAAEFMGSMGYDNLYVMYEGTMGWIGRGLPTDR